jgi:predicted nucleic acid-binding protein
MSSASPSMVPLVVDASVAIKWLVEEDGSEAALALQGRDLAAPALLRIEAANVLRTLAARKATTPDEAVALFTLLQAAPVTLVDHDDALEARALHLALALGHPVYDCVYLALAERMGRILVTADSRFLKALKATPYASQVVALDAVSP